MKKLFFAAACVAALCMTVSCNNNDRIVVKTDAPVEMNDYNDSLSWALGFSLAQNIAVTGVKIDRELLMQAICVTLDSKQQPLTQNDMSNLLADLEQRMMINRSQQEENRMNDVRAREAEYFKKLQQDNPNVKKSDKGFYYEVLKEGTGRKGEMGLVVVFDYKGMLTNGQIFDQTYGNRDAITHVISESIFEGLKEGLQLMRAGSTYRFYFPSELAFGATGTESIPPYTTVIYEVELHDVHN